MRLFASPRSAINPPRPGLALRLDIEIVLVDSPSASAFVTCSNSRSRAWLRQEIRAYCVHDRHEQKAHEYSREI